jgi:hypothetical protein
MVQHWTEFRKMWRQYYLKRAADCVTLRSGSPPSESGASEGGAAEEEVDDGLGLWKSDWLKYVGECKQQGDEVFLPHLRVFDGGTWHDGEGKCLEFGIFSLEASHTGRHMFGDVMLGLQALCKRKVPDVLMAYVDPDCSIVRAGSSSVLTLPGCHAMGPHGGDQEWQVVCLEEELYEMLCVARKCQGKLHKGAIKRGDGASESVLLLNVAVFRMHCNSWDIEVDQGGKAVLHKSGLPGIDKKVPDSAPDYGYTRDAHHAVTGACVEVETKVEMDDTLRKHPGAWVVNRQSYLMCVHTSSQTVADVKSQQWGSALADAGASGKVLSDVHKSLSGLTMQTWSKMSDREKESIWRLVGLNAAGQNPAGCSEDSMLKEESPMVGNCSYGDSCIVTHPKARWPYVCAQSGCSKYVDLECCQKFVERQKEEVQQCTYVQDVVRPCRARAYVVCHSCLVRAIKEYNRSLRPAGDSPQKQKKGRMDAHGGSASGVFASDMYSVHMQQLTPVHTWNVCTDVPCSGEGETRCELYPCVNALYPHKTEVRRVMWLQDAESDDVHEGVFAREDIEAGTFLLDFGELRVATVIESSGQWCGWRLRFDIESKLSTVTKTFVVKDAERSLGDGGDRGMSKGGKVNSTCCSVHKNAELVPDSAGIRMYVRTTRQVPKDSEILVMYQPDRGFFGGVHGRCKCCLCEKRTPECFA